MKLLYPLLLWGSSVFAQTPRFIQPLRADVPLACPGQSVHFMAEVSEASHAYLLRESGAHWDTVQVMELNSSPQRLAFELAADSLALNVRVLLRSLKGELLGAPHQVSVSQLRFNYHPRDAYQCNGGTVRFSGEAPGATVYRWEIWEAEAFQPLSETSKFKDVATAQLRITGIVNAHQGTRIRLKAVDAAGCEAFSAAATLHVHQLSTAVSPTTGAALCEGDSARFFPAIVGEQALNYQWLSRKKGSSAWVALEDTISYTGVRERSLLVHSLDTHQTSFRLRVGFPVLQYLSNSRDTGTCYLESSRLNYTINPRPVPPLLPEPFVHCGPGKLNLKVPVEVNWHASPTSPPFLERADAFSTAIVSRDSTFYLSHRSALGCSSVKVPYEVKILARPSLSLPASVPQCADLPSLKVEHYTAVENPDRLYLMYPSGRTDSIGLSETLQVPLHGESSFRYLVKNQFCSSDTLQHEVPLIPLPTISTAAEQLILCAGDTLRKQFAFENAQEAQWLSGNTVLAEGPHLRWKADSTRTFQAQVISSCGNSRKDLLTVNVVPPLQVVKAPVSQSICPGTTAVFTVVSTEATAYSWTLDGRPIGENLPELQLSEPGEVRCTLKNAGCSLTTSAVRLQLVPRPELPDLPQKYIACDSLPANFLWLNADSLPTQRPEEVRFVKYKDSLGCLSPAQVISAEVQPPFTIDAISSTDRVCTSGLFNRQASVMMLSRVPARYRLFSGPELLDSSINGKFELYAPGTYTLEGRYGACHATTTVSIAAAGPEIPAPEVPHQLLLCQNETLSTQADSTYWWKDGALAHSGSTYTFVKPAEPQIFEVSRGKTQSGLFCESERTEIEVKAKKIAFPAIEMYSNTCHTGARFESPEGHAIAKDGVSLNLLSLPPGTHLLTYLSADGCAVDTLLTVPEPQRPSIEIQPTSAQVCEGNVSQFTLDTEAAVQWQQNVNGAFIDLPGKTDKKLRFSPTAAVLHGTSYRAVVRDAGCTIYSDTVELQVNQLKGGDITLRLCEGEAFDLKLPEIIGTVAQISWFFREGSTGNFSPLPDTLLHLPTGYYRAKVTFSSGCSISGPSTRLLREARPEILGPDMVCLNDTVRLSVKNCTGPLLWSDGVTSATRSYVVQAGKYLTVQCASCTTSSLPYPALGTLALPVPAQIVLDSTGRCWGDKVRLNVENCPGEVVWSDGALGVQREFTLQAPQTLSAQCQNQPCTWSQPLRLQPAPKMEPGNLSSIENSFCAGYNPGTIQNRPAIGQDGYQWQQLDSTNHWFDIADANDQNFNPPALNRSVSYRRQAFNGCGTVVSNPVHYTVYPDPSIRLNVHKEQVCADETIEVLPQLSGGTGTCSLIYEVFNNGAWSEAHEGLNWRFTAPDADTLLKIRAKYLCSGASCNQALSPTLELRVKGKRTVEQLNVCEGTEVRLPTCGTDRVWVADRDSTFQISCPSTCGVSEHLLVVKLTKRPPAPVNSTPPYQKSPARLDVDGEDVWWYSSEQQTLAFPPSPTDVGKYTYYVSRKNGPCESVRTPISFEIVAPITWTAPLEKISVCKGKTTVYTLPIQGATQYRWERKLPEETSFSTYSTDKSLRISDSPEGSIFRVTVGNGLETWEPITLSYELNAFTAHLPNQNLCRGDSLRLSLEGGVEGEVLRYLWQTRAGTGSLWRDLDWPSKPRQVHPLADSLNEAQFRCVIYYTGGCSITTDLMSLRVGEKPFPPDHFYLSACQNEPVEKYTIPVPEGQKIQWLGAKPDISTEQVQTYALPFAYENAAGCRSETAQFYVEIKSLPGLPFNTTPPTAIDAVQFSAEGQNLRWYSSQTSKQGLSYAPHYLGPGKKTHYVSQTVGCESPRLKIETEIVPGLKIVSQPRSQGNCEGNTLTFSVRATGPEHLEYQWQILKQGQFEDLKGETKNDLRISPVSDSLTVRCRIQSGADILYSEPAKLDIYKVLSAPSQVQICGTDSVHADHLKIQGEVKNIEWQLQQGTKYLTLPPDALVTGTYRARVIFASGCIRYSGTFSVEKLPEPIFTGFPRTCPENTWGAYKRELAFTVLEEVDEQLEISQLTGQTFSARSPEGCPLKLPAFKPEYLPVPPPVPLEWTLPLFSQLPPHTWIKEDVWVSMDRLVDTLVRSYAVRTNCLSKPGILRATPVPRYYPAEKDSTFSFDEEPVYFDEKYHTFTREGEVILSADLPIPYGKLETHTKPLFKGEGKRIVHLPAAIAPVRVDWYFGIKELATENVLYGSTADSTWENLGSPPQRMAKDSAYVYLTFVHHEARSYRVVSQPFPRGTLKLLKTTPVTLGVSVPGDDFVIERKEESAEYAFWKKAEPLVIDLFPPTKKSAYRLSHLAHQRYKTVVDSVEVDTPVFLCTMLGNVLAPGEVTNLQMQDVKEMLLFSSEGKRIPLQWNLKENHANEVTLPPRLLPGIYILIASDREARQCIKKLWIK